MSTSEELYRKFRGFNNETPEINHITAKQCAGLTVDAIITEIESISFNYDIDFSKDLIPYWANVKNQIEKM